MAKLKFLGLVLLSALLTASLAFAATKSFSATLKGDNEVPAVKSKAKGDFEMTLSKDGKEMAYKLSVKDISNPSAAHLHMGKKGESGPPVVDLFKGPKRHGKVSGLLAQGIVSDKALLGDLKGKTLNDLVNMIKAGQIYVNVHTDAFPDGEIRGEVK